MIFFFWGGGMFLWVPKIPYTHRPPVILKHCFIPTSSVSISHYRNIPINSFFMYASDRSTAKRKKGTSGKERNSILRYKLTVLFYKYCHQLSAVVLLCLRIHE